MGGSRRAVPAALVAAIAALVGAGSAGGQGTGSLEGRSTLQARIQGTGPAGPFRPLGLVAGEPFVTREGGIAQARPGRAGRRRSLLYFSQLSDFHIIDEESPARVEFLDPVPEPAPFSSAWRPWEGLMPQTNDLAIRQVNSFADASTVASGNGERARMAFAITTGDSADNQQRNETRWVVSLLEGGRLDPNSGSAQTSTYDGFCQAQAALGTLDAADAPRYTGVQDYDDYAEGPDPAFYDPDDPRGTTFSAWPRYPGLMDRAQAPFDAEGLAVPSYVTFGNHDGLVQGNQAANAGIEATATGCLKPFGPIGDPRNLPEAFAALSPGSLLGALASDPSKVGFVPPDRGRQFVSKPQYKALHRTGAQADAHGFRMIDPGEESASRGAAGYYAWSPEPGFRFIALDTLSEGGVAGPSADGNIDAPQFRWLERELRAATRRDQLIVLYSHHAIASLTADVPDEVAPPCGDTEAVPPPDGQGPGHDTNPGCDLDPRDSAPVRLGDDMTELLHRYPHVIAWVAGHSHLNNVEPFRNPAGGGFWSIRTAAEIDWPQQSRLFDVMDNRDGTLSVFGTILDHASPTGVPASGTSAAGFDKITLGSISRSLSYNDPQSGGNPAFGEPAGEGEADDRNVELLVRDPRASAAGEPDGPTGGGGGDGGRDGEDGGRGEGRDRREETEAAATVAAGTEGDLPFTGYLLIPLVALGLATLAAGLGLRRRLRPPG